MSDFNDQIFNAVFWSFFITATTGFIIVLVKICAKSKCKSCDFCGIHIERDIEAEIEEEKIELSNPHTNNNDHENI